MLQDYRITLTGLSRPGHRRFRMGSEFEIACGTAADCGKTL
jgi:hypothetical protein